MINLHLTCIYLLLPSLSPLRSQLRNHSINLSHPASTRPHPQLNDFGVSISLSRMILGSEEEMSWEAEKVSGPRNMMKRGMMDRKGN